MAGKSRVRWDYLGVPILYVSNRHDFLLRWIIVEEIGFFYLFISFIIAELEMWSKANDTAGFLFFFIFLHRFLIKAWGIMMPSEVSTDYHFSLTFWIHVEINKMENGKKNSDLILKHVCTTKKLSACDLSSYHHTDIIIQSRVYWMTLIWKWNELWS